MKKFYLCLVFLVSVGIALPSVVFAGDQRGNQKEKKEKKEGKEFKNRSNGKNYNNDRYRNNRVVVVHERRHGKEARYYRPQWNPRHDFERRWVYFPRYNMYWDNYRGVYVYNTNGRWESYQEPPRAAIRVNLALEKFVELGFEFDSRSDAFSLNVRHRTVYR